MNYYKMQEVNFDTNAVEIAGKGDGFGWNVSALWVGGPWSFGASYHSSAVVDADGSFNTVTGIATSAVTSVELPYRLQIGARYQANPKLAVEFDITRTGWSSFDQLIVDAPAPYNFNITTSTNNWSDSNAYRLGATYELNDKTQLRFGYTFDETPQGDDFFSARTPDADRHLFSIGAGYDLGNGWSMDASYMYVSFTDRTISGTGPQLGADPNGTSTYAGDYNASVHLFGLGVNKSFN
jgi:long-chain fatty acid transport protein